MTQTRFPASMALLKARADLDLATYGQALGHLEDARDTLADLPEACLEISTRPGIPDHVSEILETAAHSALAAQARIVQAIVEISSHATDAPDAMCGLDDVVVSDIANADTLADAVHAMDIETQPPR